MKKRSKFPLILAAILFFAATAYFLAENGSMASPETELEFADANALVAEGRPEAAIKGYEGLLSKGIRNATIYYNLGLAHQEAGNLGPAVLNYEKAKSLDPRGGDIAAALTKARRDSGSSDLERSFLQFLTVSEWTILAALALLAAAILIITRPPRGFVAVLVTALVFLGLASTAIIMSESWSRDRAVVIQKNTSLRVSPFEQARKIVALPSGGNLVLEGDQQNGYQLVRLPSGEVGWLEEADITTITEQ